MSEEFLIALGIIMLIFGVLQIILFFKLWGMTNDVSRIWEQMSTDRPFELLKDYEVTLRIRSILKQAKRNIQIKNADQARKDLLGLMYDIENFPLKNDPYYKDTLEKGEKAVKVLLDSLTKEVK